MYKPSELQAFLKETGMHAKKGLSQNFLIDGNIIQKILNTASITAGDCVIEIGSGPGALTQALLERGAHVTAVEMDRAFADSLQRLQTPDNRLLVICNDILTFPLSDFLQKHPGKKYKVVANLPYHITTPILVLLLPLSTQIESLTIMVQKEFADRMHATVGTPEYSSFTLFLQFYGTVTQHFTVSPNCFYPKPRVHSSVVHCTLHPPLLYSDRLNLSLFEQTKQSQIEANFVRAPNEEHHCQIGKGDEEDRFGEVAVVQKGTHSTDPSIKTDTESFFQLTRTSFGQRRKMLRSSLKELYGAEKVERALLKIGHPITQRPEQLSIDDFISLYDALNAF